MRSDVVSQWSRQQSGEREEHVGNGGIYPIQNNRLWDKAHELMLHHTYCMPRYMVTFSSDYGCIMPRVFI